LFIGEGGTDSVIGNINVTNNTWSNVGSYASKATPFSGVNLSGTSGVSRNIVFKVINDPAV